jgi:hypothetical protein
LVDARSSDALNLAVLVGAPIVVALEMLEDSDRCQEGDSAEGRAAPYRTVIALGRSWSAPFFQRRVFAPVPAGAEVGGAGRRGDRGHGGARADA